MVLQTASGRWFRVGGLASLSFLSCSGAGLADSKRPAAEAPQPLARRTDDQPLQAVEGSLTTTVPPLLPAPANCLKDCASFGRCTQRGAVCVVHENADCTWSPECALEGRCSARGGACVAATVDDCIKSVACAAEHRCALGSGSTCIATDGGSPLAPQTLPVAPDAFSWIYEGPHARTPYDALSNLCVGGDSEACFAWSARSRHERLSSLPESQAHALLVETCEKGQRDACAWAGNDFETGRGVEKDLLRAARFYDRACKAGSARGCHPLGFLFQEGMGVPKDATLALLYHARACALGTPHGCVNLGSAFEKGFGVAPDPIRAGAIYMAACRAGQPVACNNVGYGLRRGLWGYPKDIDRAEEFFRAACDARAPKSCVNLAWLLREDRHGVPEAEVLSQYQRACDLNVRYCDDVATSYREGYGTARDLDKALRVARRLCAAGRSDWCKTAEDWAVH
jgi:TPR repeat protein